jgi:PTH1 family peptidyl-tRNA hydrolase
MRLVVGLGNVGRRYRNTPHNAGFWVCDRLIERHHLGEPVQKFSGSFWRGRITGTDVGVLKPETYMNLSGEAVAEAVRYLPLEAEDVIVVFDDMDLPRGRIRIRKSGGDGGHRGLMSVIEQLGTKNFPRLRLGVGRPPSGWRSTGFLLGRLGKEDREQLRQVVDRAADAVETLLERGIDEAMNRYNPSPREREEEEKA